MALSISPSQPLSRAPGGRPARARAIVHHGDTRIALKGPRHELRAPVIASVIMVGLALFGNWYCAGSGSACLRSRLTEVCCCWCHTG
jgi:hypothetical protein